MAIIAECEQCLTEYDAKRSTSRFCGPKCKQAFYRNRMVSVTPAVTVRPVTLSGSIYEKADWSGMTKAERDARWAKVKAAGCVLTGGYKMTASERANYKPASELEPGQFNHISKPGDPDYDGVCTSEWIADKRRIDRAEDADWRREHGKSKVQLQDEKILASNKMIAASVVSRKAEHGK